MGKQDRGCSLDFAGIEGKRTYLEFCERCPYYKTFMPVTGRGNIDAKIMLVGQEPGEEEDKTGQPFIGRSGLRYGTLLEELGLRRRDVYTSNLVKCRLKDNMKQHTDKIKNHCGANWLFNEIIEVEPEYIIALGEQAYSWIRAQMGLFFPVDNVKLVKFPHPSAALRSPMMEARLRCATDEFKPKLERK